MPEFRVRNAAGQLTFTLGSRACRLLTVATIGTANSGSVPVPGISSGSVVVSPVSVTTNRVRPTITKTATGLDWNYGSTPVGDRDPSLRIAVQVF